MDCRGLTLIELLLVSFIMGLMMSLSGIFYKAQVNKAHYIKTAAALATNAQYLHYKKRQTHRFKENDTTWPLLPLKTVGNGKWLYNIAFTAEPRNTDEDRFVLRAERAYPSSPDKKEYIDLNQDGETKVCQLENAQETCFLLR
jgi:prepilin-type N-terminal cleavage/methylation domain-containing protein